MLIDIHTHIISHPAPPGIQLTVDDLLKAMDSYAIDKAVVLPLESPEAFTAPTTTWEVVDVCQPYPERLIPFCVVDPRVNQNSPQTDFKAHLTPYLQAGCKGFGEHKVSLPVDDPRSMAIYRTCGELGIPILMHFDRNLNTDKPGLPDFEKVLLQFPDTIFIAHGPAWWANISAEMNLEATYPEGKVVPGGAIPRLLANYENVYADLSARSGCNALARDLDHAREFLHRHSNKLLFGTDLLNRGQELPIVAFLRDFPLETEAWQNVSHLNAERILSMG